MTTIKSLFVSALLALLLAGCVGTDFKRPDASAFQLGKTTSAEIFKVMGPPEKVSELVKNSAHLKQLTYVYATKLGAEPIHPGVTPVRVMVFSISNDILVGEQFLSTFKEDGTDFDASRVGEIAKGKTSKSEVVALFGKPNGESIYPIVNSKENTAIVYSYTQTTGGAFNLKMYSKTLSVTLNKDAVVVDVDYTEGGNK